MHFLLFFLSLPWILKDNNWQKELAEISLTQKSDCAFRMFFTTKVCSSLHSFLMQLSFGTWFQHDHTWSILTAFKDPILNIVCLQQRDSLAKLTASGPTVGQNSDLCLPQHLGSQRITNVAVLILDISISVLLITFFLCPVTQTNNGSNQLLYATNEKSSGIFFWKNQPSLSLSLQMGKLRPWGI